MTSSRSVLLVVSCVAVGLLAGCSSSSDSGVGGGGAGSTGGSTTTDDTSWGTTGTDDTSSTGTTSTGTTTGTTSTSSTGSDDCAAKATFGECDDCVCAKNQAGCDAYGQLEMANCYCGATAPCAQACAASLCADLDPDAACNTCMDGLDDACYDATSQACAADAACAAYDSASTAACANLPE